jgi:UDP-N-acetyl-D-galactosamine dehydrogenase
MGSYVADQLVKVMIRRGIDVRNARVLVLGLTFKENTPDLRNTRVIDICAELESVGLEVDVHDPWADAAEAMREYGIQLIQEPEDGAYDAVVLAVAHQEYLDWPEGRLRVVGKRDGHVLFDLKSVLPREKSDLRL